MDINPWEHLNYFDLRHLDELLAEFRFEPNDVQAIITYLKSIQTHQEASTGELAGR